MKERLTNDLFQLNSFLKEKENYFTSIRDMENLKKIEETEYHLECVISFLEGSLENQSINARITNIMIELMELENSFCKNKDYKRLFQVQEMILKLNDLRKEN